MANTNVILIAEDNPIIRHALVVMDINMPKCSGIEATILIRDHERKNRLVRTPIVAVTALPETRQECFSAGMDDFIIKPMLFERLRQLVDRWLPIAAES